MTQHIEQDKADRTTLGQRKPSSAPELSRKPPTSANDNDCGPWPLIPFSEVLNGIPSEQQQQIERFSIESARAQAIQRRSRSSWRGKLGVVTYAVGVSIAMFGWIYLLWLALAASVRGLLG